MVKADPFLGRLIRIRRLARIGIAALLAGALPVSAQITLGTADSFGVLAGSTVTNTGATVVGGNLGVSPGTAVTGFPPGIVTPPGTIHAADAVAAQAQSDLTAAYVAIAGTPTLTDLTGTDLGGLTLTPGVYGFSSAAQLTGTLTLDAGGNPNAVFIFKIGSTLTTATGSSVLVINGGSACNVFWQVGSSATLGTTTAFAGNILALTSITMNTGASLSGKALARNGAVTLAGNNVTVCPPAPAICPVITLAPATLPNGQIGAAYSQTIVASGSSALPYTYSVSSGALPPGLTLNPATGAITGSPSTTGTFNFTIRATDTNGCFGIRAYTIVIAAASCPVITLSPTSLPSGQIAVPYSQVVIASGGVAPYAYTLTGALPTGLIFNGATGAITGTPTTPGIFNFTITATDSSSCPGSRPYTIVIPGGVSTAIPTLTEWGMLILIVLMGIVALRYRRT